MLQWLLLLLLSFETFTELPAFPQKLVGWKEIKVMFWILNKGCETKSFSYGGEDEDGRDEDTETTNHVVGFSVLFYLSCSVPFHERESSGTGSDSVKIPMNILGFSNFYAFLQPSEQLTQEMKGEKDVGPMVRYNL